MESQNVDRSELVDIRSLVKISTFAGLIKKTPAWIHRLGKKSEIDLVVIDGAWFVRVNEKFRRYVR